MSDYRYERRPLVISLKDWQNGGDSFICQVFHLCQKSQGDSQNRSRLVVAFPEVVQVWEDWYNSKDPNEWFEKELK